MTSATIIFDKSTAVILINAKTLMHKSILSTNDYGNNHLDKSTVVILINATFLIHKSTLGTNDYGNNQFGLKNSSDFN